eukprot:1350325-Amorphochlora_amoeboformis.AAC.2
MAALGTGVEFWNRSVSGFGLVLEVSVGIDIDNVIDCVGRIHRIVSGIESWMVSGVGSGILSGVGFGSGVGSGSGSGVGSCSGFRIDSGKMRVISRKIDTEVGGLISMDTDIGIGRWMFGPAVEATFGRNGSVRKGSPYPCPHPSPSPAPEAETTPVARISVEFWAIIRPVPRKADRVSLWPDSCLLEDCEREHKENRKKWNGLTMIYLRLGRRRSPWFVVDDVSLKHAFDTDRSRHGGGLCGIVKSIGRGESGVRRMQLVVHHLAQLFLAGQSQLVIVRVHILKVLSAHAVLLSPVTIVVREVNIAVIAVVPPHS